MAWQAIDTAPRDGTVIRVATKGGNELRASFQGGVLNEHGNDAFGWFAEDEDTQPPCWTDGICWKKFWKPL